MANLQWSIPSMVDGLNRVQRKVLFCAFKLNIYEDVDVLEFCRSYVALESNYLRSKRDLARALFSMAHNYLGTNNINLLEPNGLSRYHGGKDHDAVPTYKYARLSPITQYLFPEEDDILLEYIKEDGNSVEPRWYMPIIPMVLVNGTDVIVTGDRSYIPKYNPMDIVSNLRCLLNDKPLQPMLPWYKGFRGNIKKAAADGYTTEGLIEEVDATTLRITELPFGVSYHDYIHFLRSMTTGNDPFIKDCIKRNADDTTLNFEVILPAENLSMAKHEGLLKKFKLTTTIKTSNMRLFNREGMIKKYDTPIQILEEFIPIRLEFYEKRKKYMLPNLEMELLKLENQVKYVTEVLEGKISFFQGNIDSLVRLLKARDIMTLGKITNTPEAAVPEEDYEYILRMPLLSFSNDGYKELCYTRDMLKNRVNDLKDDTPKSMWLKDLGSFEKLLLEGVKPSAVPKNASKKQRLSTVVAHRRHQESRCSSYGQVQH